MRWRVLALISLGVNILLAAAWLSASRPGASGSLTTSASAQGATNLTTTNILLRRQLFSWRELESTNYSTYIANLRYFGCPEQTIRDLIITEVNATYAYRRAMELVTPEQQWWRSEPDTNVLQAALEKARALDDERRALLTSLLGTKWESADMVSLPRPSRPAIVLDGPVLGALSAETKQTLQGISARSDDRLQAYLEAQRAAGKPADPVELARLNQQTRDELARVLPPGQLEEYLLRYSQSANNLRETLGRLQFFNATPDEFRKVFRDTEDIDQRLQLLSGSDDPASIQARRSLEAQKENAIKNALGPRRYEEYRLLHDPLYRDAVATAEETGTPESARLLYQINLAAASTQNAITNNPDLDPDQQAVALKELELDQMKANTLATGRQLPPDPSTATQPIRRTYTLRPGDTPAVIGMIYGVPESAIRAANPNVNFSRLRPGESITIPRNALEPPGGPAPSPFR
ncbi:MAG TPA: LysM domain-containing protein [Verrucomicrobiae bacterium]